MIPQLRRATPDDLPAICVAQGRGFGFHMTDLDVDDFRPLFEPDRFLLAGDPDDGAILGVAGSYPFDVSLPGGATLPAPGVTWVSVAVTHRRRGILRSMMTGQLRGFAAEGVALSLLTASEGGIYGRFGYGVAAHARSVEIDRRLTSFRPDAPDPGGVRIAQADEARKHAADVHRRWCAVTPAAVSRSERWWDHEFLDREHHRRGGMTALFHLLHDDGYAAYRRGRDGYCLVEELFAVTDDAHAALWRVLLGQDLVTTVHGPCPVDDPLPFLLTDARQVHTSGVKDGLWARVLDTPVTLAARTYATELDVTIEVRDPFPDAGATRAGGRFRLRGGPDGATCEPVGNTPDVQLGVAALGALLFGAHRAETLARARLLDAPDPAVRRRVDAAFRADREPQYGTEF